MLSRTGLRTLAGKQRSHREPREERSAARRLYAYRPMQDRSRNFYQRSAHRSHELPTLVPCAPAACSVDVPGGPDRRVLGDPSMGCSTRELRARVRVVRAADHRYLTGRQCHGQGGEAARSGWEVGPVGSGTVIISSRRDVEGLADAQRARARHPRLCATAVTRIPGRRRQ